MAGRHSKKQVNNRIKLIFIFLSIIFMIILGRLFVIQVLQAEFYERLAFDQRVEKTTVDSERGKILDRRGEELAINSQAKTIIAYPDMIDNPAQTAQQLAGILNINKEVIENRLNRDAQLVYLERQVSPEIHQKLSELSPAGISYINEPKRIYPRGELGSQILGFTGIDNHGLEGLEFYYDRVLSGQPGLSVGEIDVKGDNIPFSRMRSEQIDSQEGNHIQLTLDEVIQYYASNELKKAMDKYEISGGTVIVQNPNNGEILAMANEPKFNPNNFSEYDESLWRNKALQDSFEPGSVFKVFTAAMFLEYGYYNLNDKLFDPGHIRVGEAEISCWSEHGHGEQNVLEVFATSCNTGFVEMGLTMPDDEFIEGLEMFNFGQKTGIDLSGETTGNLVPSHYSQVEQATMSFGHGLSATPIQLITAGSAIANGGDLYQPELVRKISDNAGNVVSETYSEKIRQAVSAETSRKVRAMMQEAVKNGTGEEAQISGYKVAGKTGTSRHYGDEDIYNTSFLGFLPGDDPEISILVVLYDLQGDNYFASENAVPVFKNIAENIIRYKDINSAQNYLQNQYEFDRDDGIELADYTGKAPENKARLLRNKGLNVKLIGEGEKILEQIPLSGAEVHQNSTVYFLLGDTSKNSKTIIPDFRGLSAHEAELLARRHGLKLDGMVSGEVNAQYPPPGERTEFFTRIEVD